MVVGVEPLSQEQVFGVLHQPARRHLHARVQVDFGHRAHDEDRSVGERVLFGEPKAVGDRRLSHPRSVERIKHLPFEAYGVEFALALRVLGAALVKLGGLKRSARKHLKTKAALGPNVAKALVLRRQGPKQKPELGWIRAHVQRLAEYRSIGHTFRRKARKQSHLARATQRIKELRPVARFPRLPIDRGKHLGAQTAHSPVDPQDLPANPGVVHQRKGGLGQLRGLAHALERMAFGRCGSPGLIAQKFGRQGRVGERRRNGIHADGRSPFRGQRTHQALNGALGHGNARVVAHALTYGYGAEQ